MVHAEHAPGDTIMVVVALAMQSLATSDDDCGR
jgi:hypothetical protein